MNLNQLSAQDRPSGSFGAMIQFSPLAQGMNKQVPAG